MGVFTCSKLPNSYYKLQKCESFRYPIGIELSDMWPKICY